MAIPVRSRVWHIPVVLLAALSLLLASSPAEAAKAPAHTTISAHLTPATTVVGSTGVVSGSVSPRGGTVVLQRLVGNSWKTLAHQKATRSGAFSFAVRAKTAATWRLRVTRAGSKTARAGVSSALTLHVVRSSFAVGAAAAAVTAPAPVVITGSVAPKASGSIQVQRLTGAVWVTVATARLTSASAYTASTVQPAGPLQLRVVKAYTTTTAAGTSAAFTVTVRPTPGPPTIATVALPQARVGQAFFAALSASGGVPGYTWSATRLPAGLTLSAAGVLTGSPQSQGPASINATVSDAAGRTATASLPLTVAPPAGRLFSVGYDNIGQLGNGTTALEAHTLVPVIGQTAVVGTTSGFRQAYALDADGTVWSWGHGLGGELGNGQLADSATPVQVVGLGGVTAIAGMAYEALALRTDGTVWAWGTNSAGQVGDGSTTQRSAPVQVSGLTSVVAIAAGSSSGYALRKDGTLWAWGDNASGQLGDGTLTSRLVAGQITGLMGVTAIAAAGASAYALRSDGTLLAWGQNNFGQLGDGTTTPRLTPTQVTALPAVKAIAASDLDGYALTATGTVLAWGFGTTGQLGNGTTTSSATPVAVHNLTGVTAIAGNSATASARTADGSVWSWGSNAEGQLGDATTTDRSEPVQTLGLTGATALGSGHTSLANYLVGQ